MKDLAVIVPAWKEEARIGGSIAEIDRWLGRFEKDVQVRIVVEKSPDKTLEVARAAAAAAENSGKIEVVDNLVHRGKGYAVRSGMLGSEATVAMFMDADLSVPLAEIAKAYDTISREGGPDILVGTRYDSGGRITEKQGLLRQIGSRFYNILLRALGLTGIRDTQCGFKLFRGEGAAVFKKCEIDGFGFDIELLMIARRNGLRIEQLPVEWHNVPGSKFNPLSDGFRTLADAFRVRRRLS